MVAVLSSLLLASCVGQTDPGVISVVGGDLAVVTFELPGGTPYQIDYATNRCNAWFDRAMTLPASPTTIYAARAKGDVDDNGKLNGGDIRCFTLLFVGGPYGESDPCLLGGGDKADFNDDSFVDDQDIPLFVEALVGGYPPEGVVLYFQGLAASTALGDAAVALLTDPDEDETFTLATTKPVTVVELNLSPTSGSLGTSIAITIAPAIPPLAFDPSTRANWRGVYQPVTGAASTEFAISYGRELVREVSAGEAAVAVGDGAFSSSPNPMQFASVGTMIGVATIEFAEHAVRKNFSFTPTINRPTWEHVDYPDGPGGLDAPQIAGESPILDAMLLSVLPDPQHPDEELLLHAASFHLAAVVRLEETAPAQSYWPSTLRVDLISLTPAGQELDRVAHLVVEKVLGDDGDPDHLIYHNDLYKPIILVDVDLDKNAYADFVLLKVSAGGTVLIVPSTR